MLMNMIIMIMMMWSVNNLQIVVMVVDSGIKQIAVNREMSDYLRLPRNTVNISVIREFENFFAYRDM